MNTRNDERYLPSDQVRDALGAHLDQVHDNGLLLHITTGGTPDGALVPLPRLTEIGLTPVAEHGIRAARTHWGALRTRAGTDGPQGIARHKNLLAVLVDQTTVTAITRGMRVLKATDLTLTGHGIMLADDQPLTPGAYALPDGRTAHIHAPHAVQETPMDTTTLRDPDTPLDVVFDVLQNTATRAAAAYMRLAEAATTPQEEQRAQEAMTRAWQVKRRLDLSREEMITLIEQLQEETDRLRGA